MQKVTRVVAAPDRLGTEVIAVPEGTQIELDLMLESVLEGVLVTGTARTHATGECVRCLETVEQPVEASITELYAYPDREVPADDDEDEVRLLQDDLIDLEPALRDNLVPALPYQPLCDEDCPGLCSDCGARMADDPDHHHEQADPRWQALAGLDFDESRQN